MKIKFIKIKALFWILFLFLSSIIFVNRAFVYDSTISHAGLTKQAGELYNKEGKNKLNQEEIAWLLQGAIEEDTPLRWMNHFYDPVNNRGLSGLYNSAKVWSRDYNEQTGYARGNQTWQEAIYQYQKGNKKQAFIALGHTLHLLEDMTVPAHTRDDAHPEGDPYEVWVRQNYKNVDAQIIYYNNLDTYFNYLANFSNNNFYSKDTINSYLAPSISSFKNRENCLYNNEKKVLCYVIDDLSGKKTYFIDESVSSDYFSLLAPKAVGAGAGVIKLFFEEAQKQQTYSRPFWQITLAGIAQQQTAGAVVPTAGKIKDRTTDAFKELWGSGKELIYDINNATNVWNFFSDLWQTNTALARDFKDLNEMKNNLVTAPIKIASQAIETVKDSLGNDLSPEQIYQVLKNLDSAGASHNMTPSVSVPASSLSGEFQDLNNIFFLSEPTVSAPVINTAPVTNNISSLVFSGSGSGSSYAGSAGVGSVPSVESPNSENDNSLIIDQENSTSTTETFTSSTIETEPIVIVSSTPSPTSTEEIVIPDNPTTTTSTVATSTPETPFTENTSSTPDLPPSATSTTSTPEITPPENTTSTLTSGQVVINEVAWGGTQASANDEWLELFNASDFDVDLSNWVLTDGNDINFVFPTSTIIKKHSYFLMERTSEATVSNRQADVIYKGSLRDSGEKLTLKNSLGVVVDEVDCSAKWFAGRNSYDTETMERKSAGVSGSDVSNWQITPMAVWQGKDAKGKYLAGTPGSANSSVIFLSGTLENNRILSSGLYVLSSLNIPVDKTLKINPGVKIVGSLYSYLKVSGKLEILGTAENPVIFTSYQSTSSTNDFYKQDANWGSIQVLVGGQANIQGTNFNYGNSKIDMTRPTGLLYANNAIVNLDGVKFERNLNEPPRGDWPLINSLNSVLEIKNSQFLNSAKGLIVKGGSLSLSDNVFDGLGFSALESEDLVKAVVENNTFKDLGWVYFDPALGFWDRPYPLLSPVAFKNFVPETIRGNVFENNILNSWQVYGKLLASGQIDTLNEAPAIMGTLEVPAGVNLEIKLGSIIKVIPTAVVRVNGSLLSRGEEGTGRVIFTSLHDDDFGGDVDLAEPSLAQKEGNEWKQILIQSAEASVMDNTWVRFANGATSEMTEGAIFIGGAVGGTGGAAPFLANNLTIEYSRVPSVALQIKDGTGVVINGCLIKNETKRPFDPSLYTDGAGIWINGGNPQISNCVIDTFNFGIRLNPESNPELSNIEYLNVDFKQGL